ncbi:hypothetical protein [Streptomyces sp. NPDC003247]|uniref:hypothetical protein n=1 Tax=Streptomyces sp. NPDC003247 TaxID=3364677 RepID=UPI0036837286
MRRHEALTRLSESTAVRMDYVQTSDHEPYGDSVEMHHLYHRFLRRALSPADRDELSAVACRVLVSADPRRPSDVRSWPWRTVGRRGGGAGPRGAERAVGPSGAEWARTGGDGWPGRLGRLGRLG